MNREFTEGYDAGTKSVLQIGEPDNPYTIATKEWEEWEDGYICAVNEYYDELERNMDKDYIWDDWEEDVHW